MAQTSDIARSQTAYSDDEEKPRVETTGPAQPSQYPISLHSVRVYNEVEMVKFILSNTEVQRVWEVHSSILEPQSILFKRVIEYGRSGDSSEPDPCRGLRGLERSAPATNTFFLTEMEKERLEAFIQAVKPTLGQTFTAQELMDILIVANDWGFLELRTYTMAKIPALTVGPMPMIALCRRTKISKWLLKPHVELAMRLPSLNRFEIGELGPSAVAAISEARESVLKRRMTLIRADRPPNWMSSRWHRTCWTLLSDAWYNVLTSPGPDVELEDALAEEMEDLEGTKKSGPSGALTTYSICLGCDVDEKICTWMDLTQDTEIATKILKEVLGENIDDWLLHSKIV